MGGNDAGSCVGGQSWSLSTPETRKSSLDWSDFRRLEVFILK